MYLTERGETVSFDAIVRLADALGLRLEVDLVDPRKRPASTSGRSSDPVHSAMGDFEAAHMRGLGYPIGLDEPYQHYHFAGRADFIA